MIRLDRSSRIAKLCTTLKYNKALHGIKQQQPAKNEIVWIKISSCLHRASMIIKHFITQLMHNI